MCVEINQFKQDGRIKEDCNYSCNYVYNPYSVFPLIFFRPYSSPSFYYLLSFSYLTRSPPSLHLPLPAFYLSFSRSPSVLLHIFFSTLPTSIFFLVLLCSSSFSYLLLLLSLFRFVDHSLCLLVILILFLRYAFNLSSSVYFSAACKFLIPRSFPFPCQTNLSLNSLFQFFPSHSFLFCPFSLDLLLHPHSDSIFSLSFPEPRQTYLRDDLRPRPSSLDTILCSADGQLVGNL